MNQLLIAAICSSPALVLEPHGLLQDVKEATCHPSLATSVDEPYRFLISHSSKTLCYSNNVLTAQGPGQAILFSLSIIELLYSRQKALDIAEDLVFDYKPELEEIPEGVNYWESSYHSS